MKFCKNGTRGHVLIFTIANIKESNKIKFDSYSVRNSVLIISHITFSRLSRAHFFNNLSRNSCMQQSVLTTKFKIKSFNSSCFMHQVIIRIDLFQFELSIFKFAFFTTVIFTI